MNRPNYEKMQERIIDSLDGKRPSLLLHCCCGPCSAGVLEHLCRHFKVSILWYNPNIFPENENDRRLKNLKKLISSLCYDDIELIEEPYDSETYDTAVKGLEKEPEGGKRCTECFRIRINRAAVIAAEGKYDYFCTTLSLSRHKDAERINLLGREAGENYGIMWLPSDFKKKDRETRSIELCDRFGIYRQLYCGCRYSLQARLANSHSAEEAEAIFVGVKTDEQQA